MFSYRKLLLLWKLCVLLLQLLQQPFWLELHFARASAVLIVWKLHIFDFDQINAIIGFQYKLIYICMLFRILRWQFIKDFQWDSLDNCDAILMMQIFQWIFIVFAFAFHFLGFSFSLHRFDFGCILSVREMTIKTNKSHVILLELSFRWDGPLADLKIVIFSIKFRFSIYFWMTNFIFIPNNQHKIVKIHWLWSDWAPPPPYQKNQKIFVSFLFCVCNDNAPSFNNYCA